MFIREQHPFQGLLRTEDRDNEDRDNDTIKWLEEKFEKEKLVAIGVIHDSFIFLDFEKFCQASMLVQNKLMEKMRNE